MFVLHKTFSGSELVWFLPMFLTNWLFCVCFMYWLCNLPVLNNRCSKESPSPHMDTLRKEKVVTCRNYCQLVWRSRALSLKRSNAFKCKWVLMPTSITIKFHFTFCLCCLASDDLFMVRLGLSLNECQSSAMCQSSFSVPLMWSLKTKCLISHLIHLHSSGFC